MSTNTPAKNATGSIDQSIKETRREVTFEGPNDFDFDLFKYAVGSQTIASLAMRCMDSSEGTLDHDLMWSIVQLSEKFELELKSFREVR